jgi:hypothetical protein
MLIVETIAQIPANLIDQKLIYYLYILEKSDPNDANKTVEIEEKLLRESKQIRSLNLDLKKYSKKNTSSQIIYSQFDGLVLFENKFENKSVINITEEKRRHLEFEIPIQKLKFIEAEIDYAEKTWILLEDIQRLYECLCYNDDVYKQSFEGVSCKTLFIIFIKRKTPILTDYHEYI